MTNPFRYFAFAAVAIFAGTACSPTRISEVRNATIGTAGAKLIRIVSEYGVLKIDGRAGDTVANVRGRAMGSSRRVLSKIGLTAVRSGDVVTIRPTMPRRPWFKWGRSFYASMDMTITVPAGVSIEITDGSGEIVARGVGPLKISDGSGGISVRGVSGGVEIEDGSGSMDINGVDGDVKVTDGSGSISVANVTGDVTVPDDGSGSLRAQRIGGSVRVGDKGSGEMSVAHVGADLIVGEKGKGALRYDDIRGKVAVPQRRNR